MLNNVLTTSLPHIAGLNPKGGDLDYHLFITPRAVAYKSLCKDSMSKANNSKGIKDGKA